MSYLIPKLQYATPTVGQTVTIEDAIVDIRIVINPAGLLATLTVVMPSTPYNGQIVTVCSSQVVTTLTMTSSITLLGSLAAFAINSSASWVYSVTANSWFRLN